MSPTELPSSLVIVSAGRSGSTLLHDLLSRHEAATWLSAISDRFPRSPSRQAAVVHGAGWPGLGSIVRRTFPPDECYPFWSHHYGGFARPARDLEAFDLTLAARDSLRTYFRGLTAERRRPVLKVTGWPRVGFLDALLPEARFLHILRDGRDVAVSLLKMSWWNGWLGPHGWRFGPLDPDEEELWSKHGHSFVALAGLQWRKILSRMERGRGTVGEERWLDVRYEELCADPTHTLDRAQRFWGVETSERIARALREDGIRPSRGAWTTELTTMQQRELEDAVGDTLERWGYA